MKSFDRIALDSVFASSVELMDSTQAEQERTKSTEVGSMLTKLNYLCLSKKYLMLLIASINLLLCMCMCARAIILLDSVCIVLLSANDMPILVTHCFLGGLDISNLFLFCEASIIDTNFFIFRMHQEFRLADTHALWRGAAALAASAAAACTSIS